LVIEEDRAVQPTNCSQLPMLWIWLTVPFAIIAIAIATVPVLYHSLKEDRLLWAEHQAVQARMYSPEFTKGREREPMAA